MSLPSLDLTSPAGLASARTVPDLAAVAAVAAVELPVAVELGQVRIRIEDLLRIDGDSIVELDRRPADPVDIRVGGVLVARGELVAVETPTGSRLGVRLVEILERAATPPR